MWAWLTGRPWLLASIAILAILAVVYPIAGGALAARLAADKLQARLGIPVHIGHGRAGLSAVSFRDVQIGGVGPGALARVARLKVPFQAVLFRKGAVELDGMTVDARRGGADDNVTAVIEALRRRKAAAAEAGGGKEAVAGAGAVPGVVFRDGRL